MEYMSKSIEEIHEALKNGEVTSDELVKESLAKAHVNQEKCNSFVTILVMKFSLPGSDIEINLSAYILALLIIYVP